MKWEWRKDEVRLRERRGRREKGREREKKAGGRDRQTDQGTRWMRGSDVTAQEPKNSKGQHPERGWIGEGAANSHGDEDEDGFNSSGNGGKDTRCERYRMRNGNKLSV